MSAEVKSLPANPILPVLHIEDRHHAAFMAEVAAEAGVGGVFVIDHNDTGQKPYVVTQAAMEIRGRSPELWVGVNCLGMTALESLRYFEDYDVQGVWTDNALGWNATTMDPIRDQDQIRRRGDAIRDIDSSKVHFGGVSMKGRGYEEYTEDATALIARAQGFIDVVTTSGIGTGHPMSELRLKAIRDVLYDGKEPTKLAVASGVSPLNLNWHLKSADYVLVGSSIEHHFGIIDKDKLHDLMSVYLDVEISHAS